MNLLNTVLVSTNLFSGIFYCDDFAHRSFISEEHKQLLEFDPERKRDNKIKCDFCLADEAMESGKYEQKEVEIDGTVLDTWWVLVEENIYLHYAIDITAVLKNSTKRVR